MKMQRQYESKVVPLGAEFMGTLSGAQEPVWYKNIEDFSYEYIYEGQDWDKNIGKPILQPLIPIGDI